METNRTPVQSHPTESRRKCGFLGFHRIAGLRNWPRPGRSSARERREAPPIRLPDHIHGSDSGKNVHKDPTEDDHTHADGSAGARTAPPAARPTRARRFGIGAPGLLLALAVLACFLPAVRHDFICLDDHGYVTENQHVLSGFTWANLGWAFRTTEMANWHPLTWCSHMLDAQLFASRPWGHHLTSVVLHVANTLLVLVVLCRMTGAYWRSLMVAALFGLHPLHVESVAWVAERKDVLSTVFGLLTLWAYGLWVERVAKHQARAFAYYGLALAFFALGLMSKPMLVTVPCLLLLLDYWPRHRFDGSAASWWPLIREKIPFFILAAAAGVVTSLAQSRVGTLGTWQEFPWTTRVANALTAYCRYLGKGWFPTRLAVIYPFASDYPVFLTLLAATLLAGISIAAFALRRRRPYLVVGWLWFLGMLVPVIGLVQVGWQSMADRYSYLPLIGVFIMVVWGLADATAGWTRRAFVLGPVAGAVLAGCAALTWRQLGFWQDSETLFRHALAVTDNNFIAHYCLGYALAHTPARRAEAIAEYQAAVQLEPNEADVHHALGKILAETPGRLAEGIVEFRTALRLKPGNADAHVNLGIALATTADGVAEAIAEFHTALRLKPESTEAHYNLALALARQPDRLPDAIAEFQAALRIRPGFAECHNNLGTALAQLPGRLPEAIAEFQATLRLQPDHAGAHYNLAQALAQLPDHLPEAVAEYRTVLGLRPDWVGVHCNLGLVLAAMPGRLPEAIAEYETALRSQPGFAEAHNNLGNALVRMPGRTADAISEYRAALDIRPDYWEAHFNLGALLANSPDRTAEAVVHLEAALRLKPDLEPARALIAQLRARR